MSNKECSKNKLTYFLRTVKIENMVQNGVIYIFGKNHCIIIYEIKTFEIYLDKSVLDLKICNLY